MVTKKFTAVVLMLALVLQILPPFTGSTSVSAATTGGNFIFPNESYQSMAPRITTEPRVTLTGTMSQVNGSTVSYDVVQIINNKGNEDPNDDQIGQKRENITSNIYINGMNIQVFNIELFPGLNRITFNGVQGGGGAAVDSIYINYHNSPVFYDLVAQLDGNRFNIDEAGTTVVHSANSAGRNSADISITGFAPNAQSVTIVANNSSKTYNVSSSNNYQFAASPITVQKGKNLITIRVRNANQTIETTREIAFYNGSVTFYDLELSETGNPNKASLEYNPNYSVTNIGGVQVSGKIIVPNHLADDNNDGVLDPHPDPLNLIPIKSAFTLSPSNTINNTFNSNMPNPSAGNSTDAFFVYDFSVPLSTLTGGAALAFNTQYGVKLTAENEKRKAQGLPYDEGTGVMNFTLRDNNASYIDTINYLPGYKSGVAVEPLTGTTLEGVNLFGLPLAMEVFVSVPNSTSTADMVSVKSIKNVTGIAADSAYLANTGNVNFENVSSSLNQRFVYREVNGEQRLFKREIIIFKKLPFDGTQTVELSVGSGTSEVTKSVKFTVLFGPFTSYETIFEGMQIEDDTNIPGDERVTNIITNALSDFKGEINNINNTSEIRYDMTGTGPKTVFFYINNAPFELEPQPGGDPAKFQLPAASREAAFGALFNGENTIRFVFQGSKNAYEKTVKIYIIPTNLPVIPVDSAVGIYPYSSLHEQPLPNDPKFPQRGSIYTTTEASMNIFGTFDFIDLGKTVDQINQKLSFMSNPANQVTTPDKYILKIDGSTLSEPIMWDLGKRLYIVDSLNNNQTISIINENNVGNSESLAVRYDVQSETFSFILNNQRLNPDGSSSVYSFTVYNNGTTGPRATYRLEVDPTSMPYTIIRPILPAKGIVNQNFLEVIIDAPEGTDSVIINKIQAEKIEFDSDNNPSTPETTYTNTYRAYLTKLKVGQNEVKFTILRGDDKVESSFMITYTPTNIPGAQFMETMKASHKVFEGAVNLKFPKNTALVRSDYNVPANLKNQVFTGHELLFAIANSEDGVVDRRELEELPPGFDITLESFGTRFRLSYPTRFTKASPVYWIDAGMADDPTTAAYDPLTMGVDPYQFPGRTGTNGTKIPTYDDRPDDRELITSKTGELTLAFDPTMRDSVGTIITVFRYDVKAKYWENLGGVVDTKKNTITVPFNKFGYYVVGKMVYSFEDVTHHRYGRNYLEAIYSKGIMNAAGFDEFGTDLYVQRGEFASMIVKALSIPLNYELSKPHFDDVPQIINPDALWDYRYIETAARKGIITGTGSRTFQPSSNLTREQAALIITRALELKLGTDTAKVQKDLEKAFKDAGNVEAYAKPAVAALAKKGYIQGSPVDVTNPKAGFVFEPKANLTRTEAAIIIGRILADLKKLPPLYQAN